jgi:hypothetical protein
VTPDRFAQYKYRALFLTLFLLLIAYPTLRGPAGSPVLARTLLTAVFLAGGWVVFAEHRYRGVAVVLGGIALAGVWTGYALPDRPDPAVTAGLHLTAVAFQVFMVVVVVRGVHSARDVSTDVIAAALCGYLLLGVAFGHVYSAAEAVLPGAFRGLGGATDSLHAHTQLTYYSFITLTTVGYGDITPARDTTRSLALAEAVTGQFYLAVLVADLVGKRLARGLAPAEPPAGSGTPSGGPPPT